MEPMIEKALKSQGWKSLDIDSPLITLGDEVYVPGAERSNATHFPPLVGIVEKVDRDTRNFRLHTGDWVDVKNRKGLRLLVAPKQYLTLQSIMSSPGRVALDPNGREYFYHDHNIYYLNESLGNWYAISASRFESGNPLTKLKLMWKKKAD